VDAFNASEAAFEALRRQFPHNSPWLIDEVEQVARPFDDGLTTRHVTATEFVAEFLRA
jgi:hypothetical protein